MPATLFPSFRPHPLVRGGHAQTLAGVYLPWSHPAYRATRHHVVLADGDRLVLHDDRPTDWQDGDPTCLLVHGLAGCHQSGYMQRIAVKLMDRKIRAFRMDMRGCGAGEGLARGATHCGRWADVAAAVEFVAQLRPPRRRHWWASRWAARSRSIWRQSSARPRAEIWLACSRFVRRSICMP